MTASENGRGSGKDVSGSIETRVIDGELAEQLGGLVDVIEAVPWHEVPGIHPKTASAFNRLLIEARSQLLTPRVIADGGEL